MEKSVICNALSPAVLSSVTWRNQLETHTTTPFFISFHGLESGRKAVESDFWTLCSGCKTKQLLQTCGVWRAKGRESLPKCHAFASGRTGGHICMHICTKDIPVCMYTWSCFLASHTCLRLSSSERLLEFQMCFHHMCCYHVYTPGMCEMGCDLCRGTPVINSSSLWVFPLAWLSGAQSYAIPPLTTLTRLPPHRKVDCEDCVLLKLSTTCDALSRSAAC